jgi:hypothetical protein
LRRCFLVRAANNPEKKLLFELVRSSARIRVFLCLILLVAGTRPLACAQATAGEYQIKAAFLFHFAQLVDWPPGVLNPSASSLILCIFDDETHRQELQAAIEGKPVGGRVLHLRMIGHGQGPQGCNLLFLSQDELHHQSTTLKALHGLPVLTVGETADFLSDGGMIRFHLDENKIRFDINLGAADSSHLTISSRLLLLASVVVRGNAAERGK